MTCLKNSSDVRTPDTSLGRCASQVHGPGLSAAAGTPQPSTCRATGIVVTRGPPQAPLQAPCSRKAGSWSRQTFLTGSFLSGICGTGRWGRGEGLKTDVCVVAASAQARATAGRVGMLAPKQCSEGSGDKRPRVVAGGVSAMEPAAFKCRCFILISTPRHRTL